MILKKKCVPKATTEKKNRFKKANHINIIRDHCFASYPENIKIISTLYPFSIYTHCILLKFISQIYIVYFLCLCDVNYMFPRAHNTLHIYRHIEASLRRRRVDRVLHVYAIADVRDDAAMAFLFAIYAEHMQSTHIPHTIWYSNIWCKCRAANKNGSERWKAKVPGRSRCARI